MNIKLVKFPFRRKLLPTFSFILMYIQVQPLIIITQNEHYLMSIIVGMKYVLFLFDVLQRGKC